ncbi:MAG: aryl-sulfate sulfotransferase [Myxococcota bacterium]
MRLLFGGILGLAVGCGGDDDGSDDPTGSSPTEPVTFVAGPTIRDNPDAGLTAWLDLTLSDAAALEIDVTGPDRTYTIASPSAVDHTVLITGLHPESTHDLVVRAVDAEGRTIGSAPVEVTTPRLPTDFFTWQVPTSAPDRMEPGITLVGFGNYLVMLDPQGHPVWYMPVQGSIHEATRLANGDLILVVNRTTVTEVDLSGAIVRQWRAGLTTDQPASAIPLDVEATHHDVLELPDGNLVTLSIERRTIDDYPTSEVTAGAPTASAWVAGDVVVEFTPDGEVVHQWPLLDLLDPHRIAYDGVRGTYWEDFAPWVGDDIKDWSHGNAVSYDPPTDTLLVSLRHQDAVIGLARQTGALKWIIAPPVNWPADLADKVLVSTDPAPVYNYHQHGAKFTPSGTVMMFDNGNNRASAFEPVVEDPDNYSRGLELALDLDAGTYHTVWSWGQQLDPKYYAGSLGDCDPLPVTGNRVVTFGNLLNPTLPGVRIVELTPADEIVFDLVVPFQVTTYRSQRLAGMIPGL